MRFTLPVVPVSLGMRKVLPASLLGPIKIPISLNGGSFSLVILTDGPTASPIIQKNNSALRRLASHCIFITITLLLELCLGQGGIRPTKRGPVLLVFCWEL